MERKPVRKYDPPHYPVKNEFHPGELLQCTPKRWEKKFLAGVVLPAAVSLTLSGCFLNQRQVTMGEISINYSPNFWEYGTGMYILNDTDPGLLLTEDEATQIVTDELQKAGLSGRPGGTKGNDPFTPKGSSEEYDIVTEVSGRDYYIEFVSAENYVSWNQIPSSGENLLCSLREEAAELFASTNDNNIFFYDPIEDSKEDSKEMLRRQVLGFIDWLKAEGIL